MLIERDVRQRTLRLECAAEHERRAANVLDVFEQLAGGGTALASGTQIRFGWSLLHLIDDGDALRVAEPDFALWPALHWRPTIDTTLDVLAAQTALLQRLAVEGDDVWLDQLVVAVPGAADERDIFVRRTPATSDEDSGWLLGTLADPEALARETDLDAIPVAHFAAKRRDVLQALTLPNGFSALFSADRLTQVLDASGRPLLPTARAPAR